MSLPSWLASTAPMPTATTSGAGGALVDASAYFQMYVAAAPEAYNAASVVAPPVMQQYMALGIPAGTELL